MQIIIFLLEQLQHITTHDIKDLITNKNMKDLLNDYKNYLKGRQIKILELEINLIQMKKIIKMKME